MRIARAEGTTNTVTLSAIATSFGQQAFYSERKAKARTRCARLAYSPQDSAVLTELAQSLIQRRSLQEPTGEPAKTLAAASVPRADRPGRPQLPLAPRRRLPQSSAIARPGAPSPLCPMQTNAGTRA